MAPLRAPSYSRPMTAPMTDKPHTALRRGWTTGACATAATKAALTALWSGAFPEAVSIALPGGQTPQFRVETMAKGPGWAQAGIVKDAGDDPDVTHGALICVRVAQSLPDPSSGRTSEGVSFVAGEGAGTVTRPGLPIAVGEAAINPGPRQMMRAVVAELAAETGRSGDVTLTVSIPGGQALAAKTWNPRLGIVGGLSILGTTGIVRPFSCAAWIASIHRGIDVARAAGLGHVAACTGATSEKAVQTLYALPDHAMLDMGDFAGGVLKYLRRHPVARLTLGGGIGKLTKLAQGALDLHSARSQVDFAALGALARAQGLADVTKAHTALEAFDLAGDGLAAALAEAARQKADDMLAKSGCIVDVVMVDRSGKIIARAGPTE